MTLSNYLRTIRYPVLMWVSINRRETYIPVFTPDCVPFDASKIEGDLCKDPSCKAWHWNGEGKSPQSTRPNEVIEHIEAYDDEATWRRMARDLPVATK